MAITAIPTLPSASYPTRAMNTEGVAARSAQVGQIARDTGYDRQSRKDVSNTLTMATSAEKDSRAAREAQKATTSSAGDSPNIKFKDAEGTRVMEVFDSNEVLIYQVPPKGALTLIHDQQASSQVETTA